MEVRDLGGAALEPLVAEGQREQAAQREIDAPHLGLEPVRPGIALQDQGVPGGFGRGLRADVELHPSCSSRRRSAWRAKARRTMDSTPSVTSSAPSASGSHHWTASASEPASARPAVGVAR